MKVPPSQYLGVGWPAWCETDCLLDRAVNEHDRRLCSCGCGFWASETHGDDNDGWFAAEEVTCWARWAIDRAMGELKSPAPGVLFYARRKAEGED